MAAPTRSIDDLASDLRALGVEHGSVLMVHASLKAIGPVEDGARSVLAAIRAAIGDDGTMLMVLGARDDWAWVNDRPEDLRPGLLADAEPFDALTTPADPDVGVLAEVFRTAPDTLVSDHPEGRFAASGPAAEALLSDVPWDDYYGASSPLERLVASEGQVLRLGADLDTATILHYAEFLAPVADKRRVRRCRRVATPSGPEIRWVETLDDSAGIVDFDSDEDYFAVILTAYLETGRAVQGRVGGARSELIAAGDLVEFGVVWMAEHLT
ncbi:MAG: AAC(3) family N-acetyltransferase [Acidimicrobiia bacterium]|nr:AAC(3) family N-acetyltransferase [Acidimicrobiia bacterium]